ncbi:MAG TPA: rhodanese-like domain-containing protein [Ignavibacteriaceae bacterium]|jgi:rhodanese-related sulfurtransferase|nr:rhodanese-like domain-containing protein [Ignavibacteriaceae bacterium]
MFKDSGNNLIKFRDLNPSEVKQMLENNNSARLIDVREEWEHKIAHIENSKLMPMSNFMQHINELGNDDELIIYCHTGVRSANVCRFLAEKGFKNLINLKGGIEAWSVEVDPSIPRY